MPVRALSPRPSTLDREARSIEAIVSTGAGVRRAGFEERLDLRGADLSRLVGGPVLDAHRSGSTRDQLGVVEAAEMRPEGLWVRLRFRSSDAAAAVLADIGDGTLRGLSVGYGVAEWRESREDGRRVRTAVRWTPAEVSLVPVPADPGAHFRTGASLMDPEDIADDEPADAGQERETRAEVNREIRAIAETAGLTRAWADGQIDAGASADDARRAAFEAIRTRSAEPLRTMRGSVGFSHEDPAVVATRAGEALYARAHPEHQLSEPARGFAHMTIPDLARESLRRAGATTAGLSAETLITRALGGLHATSDFPLILADTTGRELRRAYAAAPAGVRRLARQTTIRDFRRKSSVALSEAAELERVAEGGEFKYGSFAEAAEGYRLHTYGKIFGVSRQALVNDDLGAFTSIGARQGAAAAGFVDAQLAALVEANPAMSDTVAVFHASHHNTASATSPADLEADLDAGRLAMRRQTGLGGAPIAIAPAFVLAPPELETDLEKLLTAVQAAKTTDVNPFSALNLVVEPRLTSTTRWYVAADPGLIDGLEFAYLEGAPGPQLETRAGFEVDGVEYKVRLDFGAGWIDHRGWYRVGA